MTKTRTQYWEIADQVVAYRDSGIDYAEIAEAFGRDVKVLAMMERVARDFPPRYRRDDLPFTLYRTISQSCRGSKVHPDPMETLTNYLAQAAKPSSKDARKWFVRQYIRTRSRVVQSAPKQSHPAIHLTVLRCANPKCGLDIGYALRTDGVLAFCSVCVERDMAAS